jgi:hypothetical protein
MISLANIFGLDCNAMRCQGSPELLFSLLYISNHCARFFAAEIKLSIVLILGNNQEKIEFAGLPLTARE